MCLRYLGVEEMNSEIERLKSELDDYKSRALYWRGECDIKGKPQPTDSYTVEQLEANGIYGLYKEE